ncbi:Dbl homology domain-containing protein [Syncephalastrum racemosum]|uniref:Dbl homology domain-containing protein n=1 Tax=Syncephalastrum racemosum TaxID=13706 RepID=A0A1X2HLI1_SYNRA|nr:Dbl homology domain-containing protein [Syncephalastrum racemosum]
MKLGKHAGKSSDNIRRGLQHIDKSSIRLLDPGELQYHITTQKTAALPAPSSDDDAASISSCSSTGSKFSIFSTAGSLFQWSANKAPSLKKIDKSMIRTEHRVEDNANAVTSAPPPIAIPDTQQEATELLTDGTDATSPQTHENKYMNSLQELYTTEESYLSDVKLIYETFGDEILRVGGQYLPESIRVVFEHYMGFMDLHRSMIEECQRYGDPSAMIFILKQHIPDIESLYRDYFVHFDEANRVLSTDPHDWPTDSLMHNMAVFIQERLALPSCRNLTLQSFLLQPIQRLMKYPLFFKSLSNCIDQENAPELYVQLLQCLDEMQAAIHRIEYYKQLQEEVARQNRLVSRIRTPISLQENAVDSSKPGRRLLHAGPLIVYPTSQKPLAARKGYDRFNASEAHPHLSNFHAFSKQAQKVYCFLFNDLFVITKTLDSNGKAKPMMVQEQELPEDCLFQVAENPGQLTCIDPCVTHLASAPTLSSSSSFYSLKSSVPTFEIHPRQFLVAVADRNIVNYHFETPTDNDKQIWLGQNLLRWAGFNFGSNNRHWRYHAPSSEVDEEYSL